MQRAVKRHPIVVDIGNMRLWRNPNPLELVPKTEQNRRRHGRLRCLNTRCSLGEVVNLSCSGMSVEARGKHAREGECFTLHIIHGDESRAVDVRIVRVQRLGMRRYQYGLEFVEPSDELRSWLVSLARESVQVHLLASDYRV